MTENLPDIVRDNSPQHDDEEIEKSRAPLMSHLVELRNRLFKSVLAILIGAIICWSFWRQIFDFIVIPYEEAAVSIAGKEALTNGSLGLIYTAPMEPLFTQLDLALFGGVCIAFPVVAFQLYRFIAPGLYKHEKNAFLPFLIMSPVLFVAGAAMAYYIAMPLAMHFSLGQQIASQAGHVKLTYQGRISEYVSLVTMFILAFGICFQLPIVQLLLSRAGLVSGQAWLKGGRYAVFFIVLIAAFVAPPDVASQVLLSVPVVILYFSGAFIAKFTEKKPEN